MNPVLLVCGSLRRDSYNHKLLKQLADHLPADLDVDELAPVSVGLPLFNQDLEQEPSYQAMAAQLHAQFSRAQGLIVASPEYNGQMTAYLKNLIDWISRLAHLDERFDNPFLDKPILLCSASTGHTGGAVGISSVRDVLAYVGGQVLGGAICISDAASKWNGEAFDWSHATQATVEFHLHRFVRALTRHS